MAKFRDHRDIKWPGAWLIENEIDQGVPEIPYNRTLFIQQLTDEAPSEPEFVDDCQTLNDVFDRYKPSKTIQLEDENGIPQETFLEFRSLLDFGKDGIINQSEFLQHIQEKKNMHADFIKRLRSIVLLRQLLSDPDTRAAYLEAIDKFIEELEEVEPEE